MAKYLATFTNTINDIEIHGFTIVTDKEIDKFENLANSITWPFSYQIGEDEIEFECGDDLLSRIEYKELTSEESKVLKKIFGDGFGLFIDEEFLEEIVSDEVDDIRNDGFDDDDDVRRDTFDEDDY